MAREICEDKSRNIVSSSTGFCYSDVTSGNSHLVINQIQGGFESNQNIFNLTTGMDMIGFTKHLQQQQQQQQQQEEEEGEGYFNKHGPSSSSSKTFNGLTSDFYLHEQFHKPDQFTTESTPWQDHNRLLLVHDSFSFRSVFERPSYQGLSLYLSSTNPSAIGLQPFELRDGFFGKAANLHHQLQFQLGCSKYLSPTQELLNEFCSLRRTDASKQKQIHDDNNGADSSRNQSLNSLDFVELQKRKTKLLSMIEEVDRRYRHYCLQMKAVASSFEAVAGTGSASVYLALASKAMSRHFRCLRDGIVGQIESTRKAMGEKGPVAPGTTRGETPRLKMIDQSLRQQRCFQQMENHPWRPQRGLPEKSVSVLRAWLFEHFLHPYPSDVDKHILARQTGLSRSQVSNWFINARVRLWKPMVEEMYLEETKEHENNMASSDGGIDDGDDNIQGWPNQNNPLIDRKPVPDQLIRVDSECLSSIVSNPGKHNAKSSKTLQNQHLHHYQKQNFGTYGAMELDFSSGGASYGSDYNANNNQSCFNGGGGGGVSLTLGLQQHGGNGVSLAFNPGSQSSLFYPRDHIEDCQPVQYSVLDGDQVQHLPYRNLMGAQLLHDFAGI